MISKIRHIHFLKYTRFHNIAHGVHWLTRPLNFLHKRNDFVPILSPDNEINARNIHNFGRRSLGITARHCNNGIWIPANRAANDLTTLLSPVFVTVHVLIR